MKTENKRPVLKMELKYWHLEILIQFLRVHAFI
jgi:hypothetical protein